MLGSALSNQSGAAVGALAFAAIGPVGVVAVRQWVAAVALLALGRPRVRTFTRRQWSLVAALAAVFAVMNLALYLAVARIGLGLAVTLEFLGPLSVALAGSLTAASPRGHRAVTFGGGLLAGTGVLLLTRPSPTTDYLGLGLGLLAAGCWASYIVLNRLVGKDFRGVDGSAAACGASALLYVPVGVAAFITHPPTLAALGCAATAGVLASVVPFITDVLALRRIPVQRYGILASINPVIAAIVGALVLGQTLGMLDYLAVALIVAANVVCVQPAQSWCLADRLAARVGRRRFWQTVPREARTSPARDPSFRRRCLPTRRRRHPVRRTRPRSRCPPVWPRRGR
ncbi:EamA family transporter [Mycolicibacterium madagascariense]|nr:EamA family transporter [Mycolicibacterium madagascariense]